MNKLTVEFEKNGKRLAVDYMQDKHLPQVPLITFKIGFETFTLSRQSFTGLINQLQMAEAVGTEYPEDLKDWVDAGFKVK